ncbi:MAG: enoyl-CoA hydratase [Betaproteobacteria bacterium]|nr:enoyl-CoA hydratase [Betaproteobacteria bacterium]
MAPSLLKRVEGQVATLTLNRPKQYNAISMTMLDEMAAALEEIAADDSIRAVVIAGAGAAFSGGHDLKEMMAKRNREFIGALFERCSSVMLQIQRLPQPVIARIHGIATAAGCQLVAACDMAVAASVARFATSGINFGLFCATPGVPVSRNISQKRAFEMLFTGEFIDAAKALDWGLVNRVVALEQLDKEIARLTGSIRQKPAAVCAAGKRLFYEQLESKLANAYRIASRSITDNLLGDDAAEGVGAFIDKRLPDWNKRGTSVEQALTPHPPVRRK